jgi:hypothetical protein
MRQFSVALVGRSPVVPPAGFAHGAASVDADRGRIRGNCRQDLLIALLRQPIHSNEHCAPPGFRKQ